MKLLAFSMANKLYERCYPAYYPLYAAWKALSDRRERALLSNLVQPGATVVDVGANIGVYTKYFSKLVGESGRVHAFEPAPSNFKRLQENTKHLPNVSLCDAAVGDSTGSIQLYLSDKLNVDHHTFDRGEGSTAIDVPLVCLDDYFSIGQQIDLMKIDVQGFELSVLKGARRLLEDNRDIKIMMEFWPYGLALAGVSSSNVIEYLTMLDFKVRTTSDPNGGVFDDCELDPSNIQHYCNLLATRR